MASNSSLLKQGSRLSLLLLTSAIVVVGGNARQALAYPCDTEQVIFIRNTTSSSYSAGNTIRAIDRGLADCPLAAHSTAHVRMGGLTGHWVETGWREDDSASGHVWYPFVEWGLNYNEQAYYLFVFYDYLVGGDDRWYVINDAGTDNWTLKLDTLSSYGVWTLVTYTDLTYTHGYAMGETGRFGGVDTGMSDIQTNLRYRNSSGTWVPWANMICYQDTATNWSWVPDGTNAYHTVKVYLTC